MYAYADALTQLEHRNRTHLSLWDHRVRPMTTPPYGGLQHRFHGARATVLPGRGLDYDVSEARRETFHAAVSRYVPGLRVEDLTPDGAGIRPKLPSSVCPVERVGTL